MPGLLRLDGIDMSIVALGEGENVQLAVGILRKAVDGPGLR
jgi:hypothetical protein